MIDSAASGQTTVVSDPVRGSTTQASVVIVNYNGGDRLKECLHSLLTSTHTAQVILVDNASTDGSADDVERAFPDVCVIRSATNRGFGGANNLGVRYSTGKFLAFLNPDTIVSPNWLAALIQALEADPQAGLATSRVLLLNDPDRINTCGNDVHCSGITLCRGMGMDYRDLPCQAEVGAVSGAAFAVRRELFEALGGFDEAFFMYMEDTDLSLRARLAGYRCVYVPDSVVWHDYALRFGPQKIFYQERNRYLMLLQALHWPTLFALLPTLLLAEAITWGFVLLREPHRWANKVKAHAWIMRHWSHIVKRRRQTQALRRVRDRDLIAVWTHRLMYEQTGEGLAAQLAHKLFDPLFLMFQKFALAVVRW